MKIFILDNLKPFTSVAEWVKKHKGHKVERIEGVDIVDDVEWAVISLGCKQCNELLIYDECSNELV